MKGERSPSEASSYTDSATGARVWQITNAPSISHPSYFLQSAFYPADEGMFFISYRTGQAQLYDVGFPDGEIRQMTGGAGIHPFSPALRPNRSEIVFTRGSDLWAVDPVTLDERQVTSFFDASLGEPSLSPDGEWAVVALKQRGENGIAVGRLNGNNWHFIPFPRTVIHPQFHPLEPEWIEFAGDPAPRMHRVRRDGTALECLYTHGNTEFIVHETFLGTTGDIVFTVWPRALCRLEWNTRQVTTIAEYNAWHIAPDRGGGRVLCDTNHPDEGLQIIDVRTGRRRQVCISGASNGGSQWRTSRYALAEDFAAARSQAKAADKLSWMEAATDTVYGPQWTHPHPSWSRTEQRVAFASDRTGVTQVYVCDFEC
jgi:hypothetical protein